MKRLPAFYLVLFCLLLSHAAESQHAGFAVLNQEWKASWIAVPDESPTGYGVYLFRKIISLPAKPDSFVIHVSADNRYKLFVNETQVSLGPARGDLEHWNYETLDIAPFLHAGRNLIAAQVWNEGAWRAEGQISLRSGFILQGNGSYEQLVNTNNEWKCTRDRSFQSLPFQTSEYYVAGPGEQIEMKEKWKGWLKPEFSDSSWKNAEIIMAGIPKNIMGGYGTVSGWLLVPSSLPRMELKNQRLMQVRRADGVEIADGFPSVKTSITVPAHTDASILLDQGFLTNAYPEIIFSGGREGTVTLGYAEALYTRYPSKGNRNETEGKIFIGRKDRILSDGSPHQVFSSLSFRTYRYLQISIITKDEPLIIEDIYGTATGYPFQMNAHLEADNPEINKILGIGWRTARLCAMETYMDCPYYEQLQYIGDARIQALISLYNSGDERLLRNAMDEMDHSRRPEGVTLSRHPSFTPQYIPTFSLWYIGMLHDYMMYGRDISYLKNKLAGERQVLQYFRKYQQPDGSLKGVPYWMFTDWVETKGWKAGVGPIGKDGCSAMIDLQLLWAYQLAADLESRFGMPAYAAQYNQYADQLKNTIRRKYWDGSKALFADRREKDLFSQHTNALAILTGLVYGKDAASAGERIISDSSLAPASIYFKFYLHMALVKAGLGNHYLEWLGLWRKNMDMGLTTWAEISDINNARSDCHAWGASPNIEFFRTVLGMESDAPGFTKVKIEPRLGALKNIKGEIPHPGGKIRVNYAWESGKWDMQIELPKHTTGTFIWKGRSYSLMEGPNHFLL